MKIEVRTPLPCNPKKPCAMESNYRELLTGEIARQLGDPHEFTGDRFHITFIWHGSPDGCDGIRNSRHYETVILSIIEGLGFWKITSSPKSMCHVYIPSDDDHLEIKIERE